MVGARGEKRRGPDMERRSGPAMMQPGYVIMYESCLTVEC